MEYFLELVGDQTIGWAAAVIVAGIFLYKVYKKVEKYFSDKALREQEKDQQLREVIEQAKKYPQWHQQSIDIRDELNTAIRGMGDKLDTMNKALQELKKETGENEATTSRYRILRFDDEIRHKKEHTKEHFDQVLEDITAYERYCEDHPCYENNKAVLAIENIRETYRRCTHEHTFL